VFCIVTATEVGVATSMKDGTVSDTNAAEYSACASDAVLAVYARNAISAAIRTCDRANTIAAAPHLELEQAGMRRTMDILALLWITWLLPPCRPSASGMVSRGLGHGRIRHYAAAIIFWTTSIPKRALNECPARGNSEGPESAVAGGAFRRRDERSLSG